MMVTSSLSVCRLRVSRRIFAPSLPTRSSLIACNYHGRFLHSSATRDATPLPHPTVPGPPPAAPQAAVVHPHDRAARKRKQAEALRQSQQTKANASKPQSALQKRFWREVSVQDVGNDLEVHLDKRPVRTVARQPLKLPQSKRLLARLIALEWDQLVTAQQALKQHYIPLTSLTSRAVDIQRADAEHGMANNEIRQSIVKLLMRYFETDTLLCWAPEKNIHEQFEMENAKSLRQHQRDVAEPIIAFLVTHCFPGVDIIPILAEDSIVPATQSKTTLSVMKSWIHDLPAYELAALERGVLATKSLLVAARLVVEWSSNFNHLRGNSANSTVQDATSSQSNRFGIEQAAEAASLEVSHQTRQWGEVEDTHDVDKEDLRRQLAADALILHPVNDDRARSRSIRIPYGVNQAPARESEITHSQDLPGVESHGVIGILNLVSSSYLISITEREQVATIRGSHIYRIRDVSLVPLSSSEAANHTIASLRAKSKSDADIGSQYSADSDVGEDFDHVRDGKEAEIGNLADRATSNARATSERQTSVQVPIRAKQIPFGLAAAKWLSKGSQSIALIAKRNQPAETLQVEDEVRLEVPTASLISKASDTASPTKLDQGGTQSLSKPATKRPRAIETLTPRIIRSARLFFSSGGFYFSYDYDISQSVRDKQEREDSISLWKEFKSVFFWNRHLLQPFINADCEDVILPVIQGFIGQHQFSIRKSESHESSINEGKQHNSLSIERNTKPTSDEDDANNFLLTLISRRSIQRAGLRYLRRGVDDEGHVANHVETEQILSAAPWNKSSNLYSLLQVRGSIPLFFSQSPYSFKPMVSMFGSIDTNHDAFRKHFQQLSDSYGDLQAVSLVEKHGTEAAVGKAYEDRMIRLNKDRDSGRKPVNFEWFDFHSVCRGMKFENVSLLLESLRENLVSFGWTVDQGGECFQKQTGILRTNCMDCLDRTNVVQSAVGGWALQEQLSGLDFRIDLQGDPQTQWFNTLWADNGDAISKQYAGTAALKGDFTRTRKRNWTGALSDFGLTLTRYYNNIFGDYFLQTQIDFFLGNAEPQIFDDFETDLLIKDHALDMRKIRYNAIDACIKIVLEDPKETLHDGWILCCPKYANTVRTRQLEECILLLTDAAVYFCRFDWNVEKVGSFERIDLLDILEIRRGAYITSTLGETHLDESKNVGLTLRYRVNQSGVIRRNTRTLQNEESAGDEMAGQNELEKQKQPRKDGVRLLAFKALQPSEAATKMRRDEDLYMDERAMTKQICSDIRDSIARAARRDQGLTEGQPISTPQVEEANIISAAEAKKGTGYVESIGHSLKKLVWS